MTDLLVLDPVVSQVEGDALLDLWRTFPAYRPSNFRPPRRAGPRPVPPLIAPPLGGRPDASSNFIRTGGRFGRADEPRHLLVARTNYFRATYAQGAHVYGHGIELLLHNQRLIQAAQHLHGRQVVVPLIVYANVLLPGQELGLHTDVPEFRGAGRNAVPLWLLVVMSHSGLFERWRIPIATAVVYLGSAQGGEFAYYPDGPTAPSKVHIPRHSSAVVLDADSIFHGVDRVNGGDDSVLAELRASMTLAYEDGGIWVLRDGEEAFARYGDDQLRVSMSWKAHCFADEEERRMWLEHTDDLPLGTVLESLVGELRHRGCLRGDDHGLSPTDLGWLLINEFVRFPPAESGERPAS